MSPLADPEERTDTHAAVDLTVVIAAYNEESTIGFQLDALAAQEWPGHSWEVVVVDNGSTDGTASVVADFATRLPRLRLLRAVEQQGLGYARNAGIAVAQSEKIAICDADDVVAPGWVAALGAALDDQTFVTGTLEVDALNPPWLVRSRGRPSAAGFSRFHGLFPVASGGNLGLLRSVWAAAGGFSTEFPGAEDVHFSFCAWKLGHELHHVPEAILHYRYRNEASVLWRQGLTYGRGRTAMCCEVRAHGLRPRRFSGWKSWVWLVASLPLLGGKRTRLRWLWVAGNRVGQLAESVRHRSLYV